MKALNLGIFVVFQGRLGSVVGAVLGNVLPFNYEGIEFSLTALFVVLTIELYKKNRLHKPFFIAIAIGLFGMVLFPPEKMLILSLSLAVFVLIAFKGSIESAE